MTVVLSTLLGVDGSTADPDNLLTPSAFFIANYGEGAVSLTSSYETVEERSRTGAAQRYGLRDRPLISVSATTSPIRSEQVRAANDQLVRRTRTRQPFPIYSDSFKVTRAGGASSVIYNVDSEYPIENIRLEAGQYIFAVVIDPKAESGPGCITEFQVVDCVGINTSSNPQQVTISTALTIQGITDTDKVLRFYPAIESEVSSETEFAVLNDEVDNISLVAEQTPRANSISALATVAAHGRTNVAQYNFHEPLLDCGTDSSARCETLPVFDFKPNFASSVSGKQTANIDRTKVGLGREIERYGDQGTTSFDFDMLFLNRSNAFEFMRFWHSRRGRLVPFWMPSLSTEIKVTNIANTTGDEYLVTAEGQFANASEVEKRKFICFITKNNERLIARIKAGSAGVAGGTVTFTIDASNSVDAGRNFGTLVTNSTISMTRFAFLAHFASDSITENWTSNGICQIRVGVEELQLEKDATLATGLTLPAVAGVTGAYSETCLAGCPDGSILGSCTTGDCCYCIQAISVDLNLPVRNTGNGTAEGQVNCGCYPTKSGCCNVKGVGNTCGAVSFGRTTDAVARDFLGCNESNQRRYAFGFKYRSQDEGSTQVEYQVFVEWLPQASAGLQRFRPLSIQSGATSTALRYENGSTTGTEVLHAPIWQDFINWFKGGRQSNGDSYAIDCGSGGACGFDQDTSGLPSDSVGDFAPVCEGFNEFSTTSVETYYPNNGNEPCCRAAAAFSGNDCTVPGANQETCCNDGFGNNSGNDCPFCPEQPINGGDCSCTCCDERFCTCKLELNVREHPLIEYRLVGYDVKGSCPGGNACTDCNNPFTMFTGLDFGLGKFSGAAQTNFTIINV